MTKRIALLGHPVAHSISPAFQQAALDACAIDAVYEAWDTRPEDLRIAVERLRSGDLMGANVTVPHKVSAMRLVDRPDPLSEQVGALNTIVHRNGLLEATNTDVTGILRSLASADVEVRGAEVLLVGAGGAARAVVVAMRSAGAARVVVANRTPERAAALAALGGTDLDMRYVPLDPEDTGFRGAVGRARIIVQSTSLGMRHGPDEAANPVPGDLMHPGQLAFDLVYVPEETPFLAAAAEAGARALGGLSMLVHQGAEAFRLWTGAPPPLDVMFDAAREALALRSTGAGGGPEDG
jgi:shikimate dehydrogenase